MKFPSWVGKVRLITLEDGRKLRHIVMCNPKVFFRGKHIIVQLIFSFMCALYDLSIGLRTVSSEIFRSSS